MLAGNTAIRSAIISHAPMRLVNSGNNNKANNISQNPLKKISCSLYGSQEGIMFMYASGCMK